MLLFFGRRLRNNSWIGIDALGNTIAGLALMFFWSCFPNHPLSQSISLGTVECRTVRLARCPLPPQLKHLGFLDCSCLLSGLSSVSDRLVYGLLGPLVAAKAADGVSQGCLSFVHSTSFRPSVCVVLQGCRSCSLVFCCWLSLTKARSAALVVPCLEIVPPLASQ